ncbi:hypothetical protein EDD98_7101 [Streptomyces sp. PanSC19]|uniref:hypothetical protein n=1 Tax=Streptomyces sp. PanSC19 TaxID=1520455 RepID=UPI000F910C59|nr:hypothetical protein [Streptomyces sp. PanSC19]ROQ24492.1 hypothetical protein EDD98_7101 [Streptomyces sp. PanSC19]
MIRDTAGSVLALAGATAAVWSPFRAWYDGRPGRDYAIDELFTGITDAKTDLLGSILLPFAFAALVTLVGVLLRSRLLVSVAGLLVLGFAVLWTVRIGQVEGGLVVGTGGKGLGEGVGYAFGGAVLLFLGALVMPGRHHAAGTSRVGRAPRHGRPPLDGPPRDRPRADRSPTDRSPTDRAPTDQAPADEGPTDRAPADGTWSDPSSAAPTQTYDMPTWDRDRDRGDGSPPPPPPPRS